MCLTILAPVLGMLALPGALAVALVGLVIRIGRQFVALPLCFSGPLTGFVGAEALGLDTRIWQKRTVAMGTSTGVVHGFLLGEATNLPKGLQRWRKNTNHIQSK